MQPEKDNRLKYVDISTIFSQKAMELEISAKQQNRSCQELAQKLVKIKPKSGEEFERVEAMKEFVIKTSRMNDNVTDLILYVRGLLSEILIDSEHLIEGSKARDSLRDAQIAIETMMNTKDNLVKDLHDFRRNQIVTK